MTPAEWENRRDRAWEEDLAVRLATERLGHPLFGYDTVDSTNEIAKLLAERGAPEGTTVGARAQTKGRGRQGRSWWSLPDRAVYCSILFRPPWTSAETVWLALISAVAVVDALSAHGLPDVQIKWPNDVLAKGRKIAGVLLEPRLGALRPDFVVVGIGVNIAHKEDDWPAELRGKATSAAMEGVQVGIGEAFASLIASLERAYFSVLSGDRGTIFRRWREAGGTESLPIF